MRKACLSSAAINLWNSKNLEELMEIGRAPTNLSGLYMGLNTGFVARFIKRVKFIKSFYPEYGTSGVQMGNNFKVQQNEPGDEYIKNFKNGSPVPEGYFRVEYSNKDWNKYPDAVLLNYGESNPWYQPARFLRDYLVQPFDNPVILFYHIR